jgi:hypothetical protein
MNDANVASFLAAHPPFVGLGREQLEAIAASPHRARLRASRNARAR